MFVYYTERSIYGAFRIIYEHLLVQNYKYSSQQLKIFRQGEFFYLFVTGIFNNIDLYV
jgi:hypothetical protein